MFLFCLVFAMSFCASIYILNKIENATPELFAAYIQNHANKECN